MDFGDIFIGLILFWILNIVVNMICGYFYDDNLRRINQDNISIVNNVNMLIDVHYSMLKDRENINKKVALL